MCFTVFSAQQYGTLFASLKVHLDKICETHPLQTVEDLIDNMKSVMGLGLESDAVPSVYRIGKKTNDPASTLEITNHFPLTEISDLAWLFSFVYLLNRRIRTSISDISSGGFSKKPHLEIIFL
ncbi:hypothetical protein ACJX0J_015411 [Zea mays]